MRELTKKERIQVDHADLIAKCAVSVLPVVANWDAADTPSKIAELCFDIGTAMAMRHVEISELAE